MKEATRLAHLGLGRRDTIILAPKDIKIEEGHNPRNYSLTENRAHLDELKLSIKAVGVQLPLLVRWEPSTKQAIVVDGECRLRAVLELINEGIEIEGIPVLQVPGGNEADRLLLALTANTGKSLSKWEAGEAFKRLANYGWSAEKIAERTGYAARYIKEAIELSDAPQEVKQLLSSQAVTPSLALQVMRKNDSGTASSILKQRATVAKATGKKKASRTKSQPKAVVNLTTVVTAILKEAEDHFEDEGKYIEIPKRLLLKLRDAAK